jgi:hypothetical protein
MVRLALAWCLLRVHSNICSMAHLLPKGIDTYLSLRYSYIRPIIKIAGMHEARPDPLVLDCGLTQALGLLPRPVVQSTYSLL